MDNGRDLLDMVCTGWETPDEQLTETEPGHNFSESAACLCVCVGWGWVWVWGWVCMCACVRALGTDCKYQLELKHNQTELAEHVVVVVGVDRDRDRGVLTWTYTRAWLGQQRGGWKALPGEPWVACSIHTPRRLTFLSTPPHIQVPSPPLPVPPQPPPPPNPATSPTPPPPLPSRTPPPQPHSPTFHTPAPRWLPLGGAAAARGGGDGRHPARVRAPLRRTALRGHTRGLPARRQLQATGQGRCGAPRVVACVCVCGGGGCVALWVVYSKPNQNNHNQLTDGNGYGVVGCRLTRGGKRRQAGT